MTRPPDTEMEDLLSLVKEGHICVLSGAGMSTGSGIPDYRGPSARTRASRPIQHQEYIKSRETRARYWARSTVGWPWMRAREPNAAHSAVAELQTMGYVDAVITQNVDGLHQRAGSERVVELHGTLGRVVCLRCGQHEPRRGFQDRILALNTGWIDRAARMAPDGDAELPAGTESAFVVPSCTNCRGTMMPDIVFFGGTVPKDRVKAAIALVDACRSLLVLGSSLTVFSGFRFVRHAAGKGIPVAIVNQGETRGDALSSVHINAPLESVLPKLVNALDGAAD